MAMTLTGGNVTFDSADHKITLFGDLTGSGGVIKTGTGTLVLNGLNGYSGPTTVSAGTIAGFGNGDNSALSVASGASLAPGDGGVGSFYSGSTISLASGSKLELEVDSSAQFGDQLSAGGNISLNGSILSVHELVGGTLPLGTELVIVTSATNVTGTFAGTPEASVISAGANSFRIHYASNQVTLTTIAGSPYSTWASAHGLDGSPGKDPAFDSDPEHDGIANGLEWILGGDPLAVSSTPLVTSTGTAANGITLNFTREETSLGGATLIVQYASNLSGTWTDVAVVQAGGSYPNGVTVTVNQANTPDGVTVHIPASNAVNSKLFARLRATMP
jgi:autotransporter-associated beta strand protein